MASPEEAAIPIAAAGQRATRPCSQSGSGIADRAARSYSCTSTAVSESQTYLQRGAEKRLSRSEHICYICWEE
ncbi:unnamed protein product [Sphagnum tenellum]